MSKKEKFYLEAGKPIPKHLGTVVDQLKRTTEIRLEMEAEAREVKARETELKEHLLENIDTKKSRGVSGLKYQAKVKTSTKFSVKDWDDVYDYVYDNDRFDLLGKSVSQTAVKELFDDGIRLPGTEKINVKTLSITKAK